MSNPEKRRALLQLGVSDEITPATRTAGHKTTMGIAELMRQMRASGPMHNVPMPFVASIMNALAEATMDFMIQDPAKREKSTARPASTRSGEQSPDIFYRVND